MKQLINLILLGFPLRLILSCFYIPFEFIITEIDLLFTCGLFVVWIFAVLGYEDLGIQKLYKRLNVISFAAVLTLVFLSPVLLELGEKISWYSHPLMKIAIHIPL